LTGSERDPLLDLRASFACSDPVSSGRKEQLTAGPQPDRRWLDLAFLIGANGNAGRCMGLAASPQKRSYAKATRFERDLDGQNATGLDLELPRGGDQSGSDLEAIRTRVEGRLEGRG